MAGVLPYTWINPYTGAVSDEPWVLISQEKWGNDKNKWDMFCGAKNPSDLSWKDAAVREAAEESCEIIGTVDEIAKKVFRMNKNEKFYLMKIKNPSNMNTTELLKRQKWRKYDDSCYQEKKRFRWVKLAELVDACANNNGVLNRPDHYLVMRPYFKSIISSQKNYFENNFL